MAGTSNSYIDLGDCDLRCEYCNACFLYGERLKGSSTKQRPKYNRCCAGGKVAIRQEVDPPESIKQLFQDKHFMENIRAYNQMFSMTSFGAQIDESVNNGRGTVCVQDFLPGLSLDRIDVSNE